jgi:signal transduction histidine kinase
MTKLLDKLIILILCLACYFQYASNLYMVVPVIVAIGASALCGYTERNAVTLAVFLAYCAACVAWLPMFFFLPLLCYDIVGTRWKWVGFVAVIPAVASFEGLPTVLCAFIVLFAVLAAVMRIRAESLDRVRADYIRLRDSAKELSLQLENKNKELMEKQDYEVNLATLNERNRIARDIHDNVGHLLSNSILQTGALLATAQDQGLRERLNTLKDTLAEGMDSIRQSVHDLHEESIDLYAEVRALTDHFDFCEISLEYGIEGNPEKKTKYALLAIVKEALSNVMRHSDATRVTVALREHPALYQLIIKDNGRIRAEGSGGIGLKNIEQRVGALSGVVNIDGANGFTVFASIPKGAVK